MRGIIGYQPWTANVEDQVIRSSTTVYTLRSLSSREQNDRLAATMANLTEVVSGSDEDPDDNSGRRYEAMVRLASRKAPREEELAGLRTSWMELDGDNPRIVLRGAEVYHPLDGGGRVRAQVPLKHRRKEEIRIINLADDPELLEMLRTHMANFVATPDPSSENPTARDPYVFTTHRGKPIDFSN